MALIALLSFVVMAMLSMAAYAQAPGGPLKTGGDGTTDDQNNQTAKDILDRYNLRFPWNKLNKKYDELKKIDDPNNKVTAPKSTQVPEKRNEFQTDGRSRPKDKDQSNTLESVKADKPTKVLAYDSCWVPCGSPTGFFTQSAPAPDPPAVKNAFIQGPFNAEPWKFPRAPEIPYPCSIAYHQDKCIAQDQPLTKRDNAIFERATGYQLPGQGQITTYGLPISDTQYQLIDRENNQRYNELLWDPERFLWAFTGTTQIASASAGNSLAGNAESSFDNAALGVANGYSGSGALINIANEASGTGPNLGAYYRKVSDAVKQVQLMYHQVYVPLAILFLLPGAVVSQVKAQVAAGFSFNAPEARSPFEGLLRATVAVFLIPATQLIVSYAIDVGNSMAYSVYDPWVNLDRIRDWSHNLSYNPPPETNIDNAILPSNNGQTQQQGPMSFFQWLINLVLDFFGFGEGLGGNTPENRTIHEHVSTLSQILEGLFNMAMLAMSTCLITLCAYQLVYMCYLFLLGPLAAAFYAWPDLQNNSNQKLFRGVFGNWVQAVITLALWRFYWMVILAIMTQRLIYLAQTGAKTNLQWEVAVFTCLLGLMLYVPFNPFDFDPAKAYDAVQKNANGQGGGGGQGGPGGSSGGQGGQGGQGGPPLLNSMQNMISQMPEGPARDQLMSAVSGVREGFDRTSPGGAIMGPHRSSDPSGGPRGPGRGPADSDAGNDGGDRRVAGDVTPPPGEGDNRTGNRQGDPTQIAAANLPPVANALVSNVGNFTGSNDTGTRTPSLGGDRRGVPGLGVTQEHLDQAQANVGRMANVLTAMGVPAAEVQKFRDMNSPQAMIAALSGRGGSQEEDDDDGTPPPRRPGDDPPRRPDDGTVIV